MAKNRVEYVADLSAPKHIEEVHHCIGRTAYGLCELRRFGRPITSFVASPSQLAKIKRGKGKLNVTAKMIQHAHYAKKGNWYGY